MAQHGQGQLGAHTGHADQPAEHRPLLRGGKAIKGYRILRKMKMHV